MSNFKQKTVYQIYPKSFKDSNNDGVGDFAGIIEKLPYLHELGVELVWLNPFYPSPQRDNGYDISDYCAIDPRFGTMTEFEQLVAEADRYGIGFMLDMVLNHVSTEHEWFQKALAGDKYYQDFFFLEPAKENGDLPTNWVSKFGGPAWEKFGATDQYYLHLFDVTQADLNWRNPNVRKELFDVVRFWMKKGVKGFRFDVINLIGKDKVLLDDPTGDGKFMYTDKPLVHDYLQEMNVATFGEDVTIVTVGEMSSTTIENCIDYTREDRHELSMAFNFHHLKVDYQDGEKWTLKPFDFEELKMLLHTWGKDMSEGDGWNALFWNNHDQPRALNRFIDVENYRVEGAKMLAATIHLNRGTPYVYMGEEIGMLDPGFDTMEKYVDVESINAYDNLIAAGNSPEMAMKIIQAKSRDNSRVPMQWSSEVNAGFSEGTPWLEVGASYKEINVVTELETGSIFRFYQRLIALRKELPIISMGDYQPYATDSKQVIAYIRETAEEKLIVLNNFYATETEVVLPEEFLAGELLVQNYAHVAIQKVQPLRAYETLALYLKK
ncbi:MAG: alpha,alpha-phosphotrehalase [Lactobacillales bacterium]|jgi:trehalose-6-phosphate hydrolase|nr:alpha,alpha-phosphotrehalase [Lactobacillales bacterium]